ncbi:MAG: tetratricopeptide (TPR) repeat protein [Arenicella sp.]|jgi:tetratricopeptide (TPR) repeat protein
MKSNLTLVGIVLLLFFINACQPNKQELPSAEWELNFDSLFFKIGKEIPGELKEEKMLEILKSEGLSDSTAGHIHYLLGLLEMSASNYDESEKNTRKSLSLLAENEPSEHRARNLYSLGLIALKRNQLYLANYYMSQAAELIIQNNYKIKYPRASSIILAMASNLNRYNKSFPNALKYAKSSLKFYEGGVSGKADVVTANLIMAEIYSDPSIQNLDSSNYYLNQAILLKDSFQVHSETVSRNIIYLKAGIFFNQEKYDSCLYYQNLIIAEDAPAQFMKHSNLIALYAELGDLDSAKFHLEQATNNYLPGDEGDALNYLENKTHYLIDSKSDSALVFFKKLQELIEKKQINESVRAIDELSTVYSLQSKESKIKKLSKEVDAVQFTLARRNLYLIGLGLLLLSAIIAIAFVISANKRKHLESENERISALNNKVDLEQRLLRSQMNPHFIFNSLGAIQSFIRQEKKVESLSYLSLFSKLLRGNLESSRAKVITLEGEVDLLEKYLQLQQIRKPNSFSYQVSLSESAEQEKEELEIPPMLIQPFVENAILHGIREMQSGGEISIKVDLSDDLLFVKVLDNGTGLLEKPKSDHQSHAIQIVKERLEILEKLTQKPAKLSIQNRTDQTGVLVELEIPLFS